MCEKQNIALNYIWLVKNMSLTFAKLFFKPIGMLIGQKQV